MNDPLHPVLRLSVAMASARCAAPRILYVGGDRAPQVVLDEAAAASLDCLAVPTVEAAKAELARGRIDLVLLAADLSRGARLVLSEFIDAMPQRPLLSTCSSVPAPAA